MIGVPAVVYVFLEQIASEVKEHYLHSAKNEHLINE